MSLPLPTHTANLSELIAGQSVQIVHLPDLGGPVHIDATVTKADHPTYYVDTEHQKGIKINRKYLTIL